MKVIKIYLSNARNQFCSSRNTDQTELARTLLGEIKEAIHSSGKIKISSEDMSNIMMGAKQFTAYITDVYRYGHKETETLKGRCNRTKPCAIINLLESFFELGRAAAKEVSDKRPQLCVGNPEKPQALVRVEWEKSTPT